MQRSRSVTYGPDRSPAIGLDLENEQTIFVAAEYGDSNEETQIIEHMSLDVVI